MGTHFGATTKEIADEISQLSSKPYTTYVKGGITYYVWSYLTTTLPREIFTTGPYNPTCDILIIAGGGGTNRDKAFLMDCRQPQ